MKKGIKLISEILVSRVIDLIKLNLLTLVFILPIVTAPGAIVAACRIVIMMIDEEEFDLFPEYIKWFKREAIVALVGTLVFLVVFSLCTFSIFLYGVYFSNSPLLLFFVGVGIMLAIVLMLSFNHFLVLRASVVLSFWATLKDAWLLALAKLVANIFYLILILIILLVIASLWPYSAALLPVILISLVVLVITVNAYENIESFVLKKGD